MQTSTIGIVDIQPYQTNQKSKSIQQSTLISLTNKSGNESYFLADINYRIDYKMKKWKYLGILKNSYKKENSRLLSNSGFIHIRAIKHLNPLYYLETYIQREYDQFTDLNERQLFGQNIRLNVTLNPNKQIIIAAGPLIEKESTRSLPTKYYLRVNSYIFYKTNITQNNTYQTITYLQPALEKITNFRTYSNHHLIMEINNKIALKTSLLFKYNNTPPNGIKKYDSEINQSINIQF
tara:strand:+ start:196 stop:903 length:708 start_codon:yes stop_codon:yes gene_type:complete